MHRSRRACRDADRRRGLLDHFARISLAGAPPWAPGLGGSRSSRAASPLLPEFLAGLPLKHLFRVVARGSFAVGMEYSSLFLSARAPCLLAACPGRLT